MTALFWIGVAAFLSGLSLTLMAQKHRTQVAPPMCSPNPRHWKPVWLLRGCYTPAGFRLNLFGWAVMTIGLVFLIVYWSQ